MNDVTKMVEEAENLSTTLNFIKRCCQNMGCDDNCYFFDGYRCVFSHDVEKWDIEKIMLNVGRVIGRREAE